MPKGGKQPGAGRPVNSGQYGCPTKPMRGPTGAEAATNMYWQLYAATKCILTAARLLVAQLETNEKKKIIGWLTDNNGNKCSVEYFGSREAAQKAIRQPTQANNKGDE